MSDIIMQNLLDKMDRQFEISSKTLNEIKGLGDIMCREVRGIKDEVDDLKKRVREVELRCTAEHGGPNRHKNSAEGYIAKLALSSWKIIFGAILGGLGMMIAGKLFF